MLLLSRGRAAITAAAAASTELFRFLFNTQEGGDADNTDAVTVSPPVGKDRVRRLFRETTGLLLALVVVAVLTLFLFVIIVVVVGIVVVAVVVAAAVVAAGVDQ